MTSNALPHVTAGGSAQSRTGSGGEPSATGAHNRQIEDALKGLIDRYGEGLLAESSRLKSFLADECPNAKREISVLLQALDEQVPQDLLRVHSGEPMQSLGPRLAKRLSEQKALAPDASRWAVRTWAQGLGVSAVAMDLGAPALGEPPTDDASPALNHPAANDWLELSVPHAWLDPSQQRSGMPEQDDTRQDTQGGWFSRPANRWMTLVVAVIVAALAYLGVTRQSLDVTRVDAAEALVADGRKHDVQVSFRPNANAQNVEVQFVRGDGNFDKQPHSYPVSSDAATRGQVAAGDIALRSVKPVQATFQYTLIGADGKRSAPFERTFDFAAGPLDPPVIAAIRAPRSVALGKPYSFTIAYNAGPGGKIVSVERRVVDSSVKWVDQQFATNVSDLPASVKQGEIVYPFQPMNLTSHQTLEFVLVDESGARSEPKQVTYDVSEAVAAAPVRDAVAGCTTSTCGRVVNVTETKVQGEGTGIGAVIGGAVGGFLGNLVGKGRGKTAATVAGVAGGAVAGHEGEKYARGTTTYHVTVRLDNGKTRTLTQSQKVETGAYVRIANNSAMPAN